MDRKALAYEILGEIQQEMRIIREGQYLHPDQLANLEKLFKELVIEALAEVV